MRMYFPFDLKNAFELMRFRIFEKTFCWTQGVTSKLVSISLSTRLTPIRVTRLVLHWNNMIFFHRIIEESKWFWRIFLEFFCLFMSNGLL